MTQTQASAETGTKPPRRLRTRLKTIDDVCKELARLYREGKAGIRPVQDVSRLANVLQILARCIEGGDLEKRIQKLEEAQQ